MSGRRHRGHAGQDFLAVPVEHEAVAHRHEILAGVDDEVLHRAAHLAFIGPVIEITLGDVELGVREEHPASVVDHTADMIDMGMGENHGVDVIRLDAGFRHALLLAPGGRAEHFQGAHAGVEQHELVARVHDRRVLLQHDIVRRQEIVGQHLPDFVIGRAGEGALGRAKWQRAVGNHSDLGVTEIEPVEIGRLCIELGRAGQRAAAKHRGGAETTAECQQGPPRNLNCHFVSSIVLCDNEILSPRANL